MINNYLKATRGSNFEFYSGNLLPFFVQIFNILAEMMGLPETSRPELIVITSPTKNCEYVKLGTKVYVVFDKSLLDELINWLSIYHGQTSNGVDQTELVKYLGLRLMAEEYYVQGDYKKAHLLGTVCQDLFDEVSPEPIHRSTLLHGLIIISSFIISHELFHWVATEYRSVPDVTLSLQEDLLKGLEVRKDQSDLRTPWEQRYNSVGGNDFFIPDQVDDLFGNIEHLSNSVVSAAKEEDEDVRCDMLAFMGTAELCSMFDISYQEIVNNIFLMFRNLRVIEYLRQFPRLGDDLEVGDSAINVYVRKLQSRHFALRQLWLIDGKEKGYSNGEISDISDNHDEIIDYLIIAAYPIAAFKMLNDPHVVHNTNQAHNLYPEAEFINAIRKSLELPWQTS